MRKHPSVVTAAQLDDFDEIIDTRSPSECARDHMPGAIACPVPDDAKCARGRVRLVRRGAGVG